MSDEEARLPLNGIDKLRSIAMAGRIGADDALMAQAVGLSPDAYAFGCEIILALAAEGRLEEALGPLPPDEIGGPADASS